MTELTVMSFNIRYGDAPDAENAWPFRKDAVIAMLAEQRPALLGLQEAMGYQIDAIRNAFPQYGFIGRGHLTGNYSEEHTAILFDQQMLSPLQHDTFWYADTPKQPGSKNWGNDIPRTCNWVQLLWKNTKQTFRIYNSHWDHEQEALRERSAQQLLQQISRQVTTKDPVVVLGDFNCGESAPAFRKLLSNNDLALQDSYRLIHPNATGVGSFHQFTGSRIGEKVDAILVSPHWQVKAAEIISGKFLQRYPSDHFSVTATLSLIQSLSKGLD